ncbi:MAG: hypothetical protein ACR2HS_00815 [Gammaproteobacteria bacterium]
MPDNNKASQDTDEELLAKRQKTEKQEEQVGTLSVFNNWSATATFQSENVQNSGGAVEDSAESFP